jgi:hypothetical protein
MIRSATATWRGSSARPGDEEEWTDMERTKESVTSLLKSDAKESKKLVCSLCGEPATQTVDGEPSCAAHIGQIYEHQVEDYTRKHLADNEWCKF